MNNQQTVGAMWPVLAVTVLSLIQWKLGAEMTASLVAAIVGAAVIIRDAFVVLSAEPEQPASRGIGDWSEADIHGNRPSKIRRFLLGG